MLLWLALEPRRLSKNAKEAIRKARLDDGLAISAITLWEIAWLAENRRIETTMSVELFVRECVSRVSVLPITPGIAARAVSFSDPYPHDPQDRLIGATALVEGLPLVTHDKLVKRSGMVPIIW